LITAEECEQAMAEEIAAMLERGDDVGDLENAEIKDMQYIEQCTYEQVRFDAVIPPAVFAEQDL
jgi:hypothetical protein